MKIPRGGQPLIAMRKQGIVPAGEVWVVVGNGREPDWWRWSNTYDTPELLVRPGDSVERLDLRCLVGLKVILFAADWNDRVARLYERMLEYVQEVLVNSPAFEQDIGWRWIKGIGKVEFGETHYIKDLEDAEGDRSRASFSGDQKAYDAAAQREKQLSEAAPWLK